MRFCAVICCAWNDDRKAQCPPVSVCVYVKLIKPISKGIQLVQEPDRQSLCVCVSEGKKKSFGEAAAKFREASSRHRKTIVLTAREREQRQLVVSARRPPRERTENVRRHSHRRRRRRRSEQHRHRVVLKSVSPCVCVCVCVSLCV